MHHNILLVEISIFLLKIISSIINDQTFTHPHMPLDADTQALGIM